MAPNTLITLGGLILFGLFVLSTNNIILNQTDVAVSSEFQISAIGFGQSLIEEAKMKKFDEAEITGTIQTVNNLTASGSLGRETGETYTSPDSSYTGNFASLRNFDDFDDYNNYRRIVSSPRAENFTVSSTVTYVSETWPDSNVTTRTFAKKIRVTVTSPYLQRSIVLEYVSIF